MPMITWEQNLDFRMLIAPEIFNLSSKVDLKKWQMC